MWGRMELKILEKNLSFLNIGNSFLSPGIAISDILRKQPGTRAPDGSRGAGRIFLRASVVVFLLIR